MAKEKIYPYAVGRIRSLEKDLFDKQTLFSLADSKSIDDACRMLTDMGFGGKDDVKGRDYEKLLNTEQKKLFELIKDVAGETPLYDIFASKYSFHNLKVLIKQELSGLNGEAYLTECGNVPLDKIKDAVLEKHFSFLPKIMAKAAQDACNEYSKTQSGQSIDVVIDKATFLQIKEYAEMSDEPFIKNYVSILADTTNLKTFIRIKKMGKGFKLMEDAFVFGGTIQLSTFKDVFESENPAQRFYGTRYGSICQNGFNDEFTEFEKLCDNFIMDYMKDAKFKAITIEPVVAYAYAKEAEIKAVRIILAGKLNDIDPDVIKERLRDAYV